MDKRGYKHDLTNYKEYFKGLSGTGDVDIDKCFEKKMDVRYYKQCYYNLEEKYMCGGISQEEWIKFLKGVLGIIQYDI